MGEHQRAYYQRNKEKEKARSKAWRDAHPGYSARKTRETLERDPDYWRRWAAGHRENTRAADLRHQAKDPARYREVKRRAKKAWRDANPERNAIACLTWQIKKIGLA